MDIDRIDTFAQTRSANPSRRLIVHLLTGSALGNLIGCFRWAEVDAHKRKRKRRRKHRRDQQDQCVPNAIPFEPPTGFCANDSQCCGTGSCCTFGGDPGEQAAACYDLLTHTTACGRSCDTVVNCFNTGQQCVNGECV